MQNSVVIFTFTVLDWKYPFWANWVQKVKIISSSWNFVPTLLRICKIQRRCSLFFVLNHKGAFFDKFGPKRQNYQFKLTFGCYANSNMQNSIAMLIFFVFNQKCFSWANLVQKVKIISFSWNLVPKPIRICRIQWWCSLFLLLIGNTFFGKI